MKLNRDVLIHAIIKHQNVFFKLLDYIALNDGANEVPESLYLQLYNNVICKDVDEKVHRYLSIESLSENGIFIHNDPNTGQITLERVIVDLLSFLDVKRARELDHAEFENIRVGIVAACEQIKKYEISSLDYKEAKGAFNRLMSDIHSKIKENVLALTHQVDSIALEYKSYDQGNNAVNVIELYDKVSNLYSRYVMPCYDFINPSMEMAQTQSFSMAVDGLISYYKSELNLFDQATLVQFRKKAITSYYKDIGGLVRKLDQYSNHLSQDRSFYLSIESAFSHLMESIEPLRHGLKRNMYLTRKSEIFNNHNALDGLTRFKSKFKPKLQWHQNKTKLRFKEYLLTVNETLFKEPVKQLKPLTVECNVSDERKIVISLIIDKFDEDRKLPDVHQFLHHELSQSLSDFELSDVLYGLEVFLPFYSGTERAFPVKRKRLEDDVYYLEYVQLKYSGSIEYV
ncbi:MAG: hypothetical protein HRT51_06715 [Colwellia sp.]|nr:hypothetical protein [Colwellia sp.]